MGARFARVSRWRCFECGFISRHVYADPLRDVQLQVTFVSPSGTSHTTDGFWDGSTTWKARFAPGEIGLWHYTTTCSNPSDKGLQGRTGRFLCAETHEGTRFDVHGPLQITLGQHYLSHADGTPFFWLADTAWNGPLKSTPEDWSVYLRTRARQRFTAVQWVATHWLAAPTGDRLGRLPYTGCDLITINPAFFRELDNRCRAINQAGMVSVPAMLWAAEWSSDQAQRDINPGVSLPELQAILLARYMVARWGAYHVAWILPGDGDYTGPKAARWQRIGRAVFDGNPSAVAALHPMGMSIPADEFRDEKWLSIVGYQSSHWSDDRALTWLLEDLPTTVQRLDRPCPIINLEPPYENHVDLANPPHRLDDYLVRRALYWSLLVTPTAGTSYGAHGVWGWDDGRTSPVGHENSGVPLAWNLALNLPGAQQVAHLAECFSLIDWWRLRPAPDLIVDQPGMLHKAHQVAAAQTDRGDIAIVYVPRACVVGLRLAKLQDKLSAFWFNPRTGERLPAQPQNEADLGWYETPADGDWLLVLKDPVTIPARMIS